MLFLTDGSCSSEVETLFCMNMQLFRIRVKGRQGLVALFKYTLLSSIMLKFFTLPPPPAHILPPPNPPKAGDTPSRSFHFRGGLPSFRSPHCCVCSLCRRQNFWVLTLKTVTLTSPVNPQPVHNAWHKEHLWRSGSSEYFVYEGITTVSEHHRVHQCQDNLPWGGSR